MSDSLDILVEHMRHHFNGLNDDELVDHLGLWRDLCRRRFDFVGAVIWQMFLDVFIRRNGKGADEEAGSATALYLLMYGRSFLEIRDNLRQFFFWKDIMPLVIKWRMELPDHIRKYEPGGEFTKVQVVQKIMADASAKNVRTLMSIIDNRRGFVAEVRRDFVYKDLVDTLRSDDEDYKKALVGFSHLYYLVNRYGIILTDEDIEGLGKDPDELNLESCLGCESLSFIKGLSDRLDDGDKKSGNLSMGNNFIQPDH